jgi:hypothetical protein
MANNVYYMLGHVPPANGRVVNLIQERPVG